MEPEDKDRTSKASPPAQPWPGWHRRKLDICSHDADGDHPVNTQRTDTDMLKRLLSAKLGNAALDYWRALRTYMTGKLSHAEFERRALDCLGPSNRTSPRHSFHPSLTQTTRTLHISPAHLHTPCLSIYPSIPGHASTRMKYLYTRKLPCATTTTTTTCITIAPRVLQCISTTNSCWESCTMRKATCPRLRGPRQMAFPRSGAPVSPASARLTWTTRTTWRCSCMETSAQRHRHP